MEKEHRSGMKAHFRWYAYALVVAWSLAWAVPAPVLAAESPSAAEKRSLQERCIPLRRVRDVDIVDERTLIWHVSASKFRTYKMTLAIDCPDLLAREAFVHSSTGNRLCDFGAEWLRVVGASHMVCPIARIEPWEPPEEENGSEETDQEDTD